MMDFDVFPLNEGYYTIGFDKIFHPFNMEVDKLEARSKGSLLVEIQPFLVRTANGRNILFDTGLGFTNDVGMLVIAENLNRYGVGMDDISAVVLSHLHKDHAGGLTFINRYGEQEETFKYADYYIGEEEFSFALEKGEPSYTIADFQFLKGREDVHWMGKKGTILDFVHYEQDGGHCPFHTSFLLEGSRKFFFGGDVVPQLKQLTHRYMAKYDFDGRKSMDLREKYAKKGMEEDWEFMFYHDVKTPLAKLN